MNWNQVILGICGINLLLVILWLIIGALQRRCGRGKNSCARCGQSDAQYRFDKIEGLFCKIEAHLWFAQPDFEATSIGAHSTAQEEVKR